MAEMPQFVGLCPVHVGEWYMPMDDDGPFTCPECDEQLVVFSRIPEIAAKGLLHATARRSRDAAGVASPAGLGRNQNREER